MTVAFLLYSVYKVSMLFESQLSAPTGRAALRKIRVEAIISTLLSTGPLARTDLAQLTGYSPSAVTGIVHELSAAGYLRELGQQQSTGGRRRVLFELNRSSVTVAVVDFTEKRVSCTLVDLDGAVLDSDEGELDFAHPVTSISDVISAVKNRAEIPPVHVVLALPGVLTSEGSPALAPTLASMADLHLADELETATGLATTIENDVTLIALGESESGAGDGVADMVLIHVDEGIGATIIAKGEVLEGSSRSAGEIGFLPQSLRASVCGEQGEYESRWNARGISALAESRGLKLPADSVIEALCSSAEPPAQQLLAEVIQAWAFAAIVCVCVVNPARIIFSGQAVLLGDSARIALGELVQRSAPSSAEVVFAQLGHSGLLHGAIAKVLKTPEQLFSLGSTPPSL